MTPRLLDTNMLIALLWPAHIHHEAAHAWYGRNSRTPWATCPLTQSGFVRIMSNPKFSRDAVSPNEASIRLAENLANSRHRFLPASIPFAQAVEDFRSLIHAHRQTTDAYLLGLAMHHHAKLATFDQGVRSLAPAGSPQAGFLEILGTP